MQDIYKLIEAQQAAIHSLNLEVIFSSLFLKYLHSVVVYLAC
jgi:hypothetical protein